MKILKFLAYALLAIILAPFVLTFVGAFLLMGFVLSIVIYATTFAMVLQLIN